MVVQGSKECWKKPRQLAFNHNDTFGIARRVTIKYNWDVIQDVSIYWKDYFFDF